MKAKFRLKPLAPVIAVTFFLATATARAIPMDPELQDSVTMAFVDLLPADEDVLVFMPPRAAMTPDWADRHDMLPLSNASTLASSADVQTIAHYGTTVKDHAANPHNGAYYNFGPELFASAQEPETSRMLLAGLGLMLIVAWRRIEGG